MFTAPHGDATAFVLRQPVGPLTRELIRRVVNRHGATIGLDYLRPHDLRRTLAGILDARGLAVQDIQLVMRHQTLTATQAYLADNPLRVRRRMQSFVIRLDAPDGVLRCGRSTIWESGSRQPTTEFGYPPTRRTLSDGALGAVAPRRGTRFRRNAGRGTGAACARRP